jgi:hypothetical protein
MMLIKIIRIIFFSIILLSYWVVNLILINDNFTPLVLSYIHKDSQISKSIKLIRQHPIRFNFKARDNNLGIISIRIKKINHRSEEKDDILIFRLKEAEDLSWRVVQNYSTNIINDNSYFPMGIPLITDSKNKEYVFEIESQNGTSSSNIEIADKIPVIVTRYKYNKNDVFSSVDSFVSFMNKKIILSFTNYLVDSIFYILPFCAYIIFEILFFKYLRVSFDLAPKYVIYISIIYVIINSILSVDINDFLIIIFFLLIILLFHRSNPQNQKYFTDFINYGLLLLLLSSVSIFISQKIANNFAIWSLTTLILGYYFQTFLYYKNSNIFHEKS